MTPTSIETAIREFFHAVYPTCGIIVRGAGTENLQASIQFGTTTIIHWTCELDSDDDGFFHFYLADTTICILVPYPE